MADDNDLEIRWPVIRAMRRKIEITDRASVGHREDRIVPGAPFATE
jgi:hypothetical protein